jgi:hypothetical protein
MSTTLSNIHEKIEAERASARAICDAHGADSAECAAAWDAVEELQAEAAHQSQTPAPTNFQNYCSDNPDAVECRIYED